MRDPFQTLSGNIDAQIAFELLCYALVAAITFVNFASTWFNYRKPSLVEITLFFFALIAVASTAWSADPTLTLVRSSQLLILFIFLFVTTHLMTPEAIMRAVRNTLVLGVTGFALIAIVVPSANGTRVGYEGYARFSWFAVHPITAANEAAAALVLVVAEALFMNGCWRRRIAGLPLSLYAIVLAWILYATGTRGSTGAAVVTIGILCAIKEATRRASGPPASQRTRLATLLFAAVAVVVLVRLHVVHFGLHEYLYRYGEGFNLNGRTDLWKLALGLFERRPLFGWGFLSCPAVLLPLTSHGGEAHNVVLESVLDMGLIGSLFLWLPILSTLAAKPPVAEGQTGESTWLAVVIKAVLLLVLIEGMTDEVFLLFSGYDPVMTFASIFAFWASRARVSSTLGDQEYAAYRRQPLRATLAQVPGS